MTQVCKICGKKATDGCQAAIPAITGELCQPCRRRLSAGADHGAWLEALAAPVLLLQGQPRQVVAANQRALALFGKELFEVAGHRGGQVFDCLHSFSAAGCGLDSHCEECKIKGAIVDTFATDTPHHAVAATLPLKKGDGIRNYLLQVSTQKIGDLALVRVERYEGV